MSAPAPSGRILGIDYGSRRVGLAVSDALRLTAHALDVVPRHQALARITELAENLGVAEVVVGLPTALSGNEGMAAVAARAFAGDIEAATGLTVTLIDERFSTVTAEKVMLAAGTKRRARRQSIDKVAAAVILQAFLDRSS